MRHGAPPALPWLVMGDDPRLMAQVSALLAKRNAYLPLVDGPRLTRPDAESEILRRNNAAARLQPRQVIFAGLPTSTCTLFAKHFGTRRTLRIEHVREIQPADESGPRRNLPLVWGSKNIGLGLLRALRAKSQIDFHELAEAPGEHVPSRSGHLVVCEDGNELAQVIAANYAFALDAGLCVIPSVPSTEAEELLERFYAVYEPSPHTPTALLEALRNQLRSMAGPLPVPVGGAVTFISKHIPWGFAFAEWPSTHLFSYPDLGVSIINGIAAEQGDAQGIRTAAIIDPGSVDSQEVTAALGRLVASGVFSTGVRGKRATVNRVVNLVESFPYDLLLISTHCGDASGWRWTYEFIDSEGLPRVLVTDIAIGVQFVPGREDVRVTQFERFVSLDGVDWNDPEKKARLYVGQAIRDWAAHAEAGTPLEPVSRVEIDRVRGSMALKMADNNYIALPEALAGGGGAPIIINNACGSWHRLASTFTFGNARAYIGTLFDVIDPVAQDVAKRLFGNYWNKPLSVALWRAQNDATEGSVKRPYVMVGCHFQTLRATTGQNLEYAVAELRSQILHWSRRLEEPSGLSPNARDRLAERVKYLEEHIAAIRDHVTRSNVRK